MIKRFCDPCGQEIKNTANRDVWGLVINNGDTPVAVKVECMVTIDGTTNGGDICSTCIVMTVSQGELLRHNTR